MRRGWTKKSAAIVALVPLVVLAASCGGSGGSRNAQSAKPTTITFDGVWTGAEANHFQSVIDAFEKSNPNVKVNYKPVGDNLPTVLSTAVTGGHPPDMADIAQPGLVKQFADQGKLKPVTYAMPTFSANFSHAWLALSTFNKTLYGLVFKASNKSTIWYNVHAFDTAGIKPPATWPQLLKDAATIQQSGTPAYSIGGADGWTLTDLFENIYVREAGVTKYNLLAAHRIPWTDHSVTTALMTMAQIIGNTSNMAGGTSGAVQTDFPTSVNNVFQNPPKAAMVIEGDFVPGVATVKAAAAKDYNVFTFPSIGGSSPSVEVGGDTVVTFKDNPGIEAFMKFLGTSAAAAAWAKFGGFATANEHMPLSVYPDAITRTTAGAIPKARTVVFDMSDEQPGSFGATVGQGEWGLFQSLLRNPRNVNGIQSQLESEAAAAYKKGA